MSHAIFIVKTGEGVGLEIRPKLDGYERTLLTSDVQTRSLDSEFVTGQDYTGWGISAVNGHVGIREAKVRTTASLIVKVLGKYGIHAEIVED